MDEEVRDLKIWRHTLEGMGIMGLVERVKEVELKQQEEALNRVEFRYTISSLKEGMTELSTTIKGFHQDLATIRKLFIASICLIAFSILLPPELVMELIHLATKLL